MKRPNPAPATAASAIARREGVARRASVMAELALLDQEGARQRLAELIRAGDERVLRMRVSRMLRLVPRIAGAKRRAILVAAAVPCGDDRVDQLSMLGRERLAETLIRWPSAMPDPWAEIARLQAAVDALIAGIDAHERMIHDEGQPPEAFAQADRALYELRQRAVRPTRELRVA